MTSSTVHYESSHGVSIAQFFPVGGTLRAEQWVDLAELARAHGDGKVYLTQASTVELHGVEDAAALTAAVEASSVRVGPCPITASPLSPRAAEVAHKVAAALTGVDVSPRVTVGIDGGTGDVRAISPHVVLQLNGESHATVTSTREADGHEMSTPQKLDAAVEKLVDLVTGHDGASPIVALPELSTEDRVAHGGVGWLERADEPGIVDLGAGVYEDVLQADLAELLGRGELTATVNQWHGLTIHGLPEGDADAVLRVLAPRGFIFDVNSALLLGR